MLNRKWKRSVKPTRMPPRVESARTGYRISRETKSIGVSCKVTAADSKACKQCLREYIECCPAIGWWGHSVSGLNRTRGDRQLCGRNATRHRPRLRRKVGYCIALASRMHQFLSYSQNNILHFFIILYVYMCGLYLFLLFYKRLFLRRCLNLMFLSSFSMFMSRKVTCKHYSLLLKYHISMPTCLDYKNKINNHYKGVSSSLIEIALQFYNACKATNIFS